MTEPTLRLHVVRGHPGAKRTYNIQTDRGPLGGLTAACPMMSRAEHTVLMTIEITATLDCVIATYT